MKHAEFEYKILIKNVCKRIRLYTRKLLKIFSKLPHRAFIYVSIGRRIVKIYEETWELWFK